MIPLIEFINTNIDSINVSISIKSKPPPLSFIKKNFFYNIVEN